MTPPPSGPPSGVRVFAVLLVVAAVFAVIIGATLYFTHEDKAAKGLGPVALRTPLRFQQVAEAAPPPCKPDALPAADAKTCYLLGTATMTVGQVEGIRAQGPDPKNGRTGWSVVVALHPADAPRFAALSEQAHREYQRSPSAPGAGLAIIGDGRVLSAPQMAGVITSGNFDISGPPEQFTREYVTDLVHRLTGR
ncbi:SecDF P1 head subdomain-containing protein [Actinomadura macrotermitis]|uniref:SecDF P1 head subdomain domain-containing protein n=1 Tax=Actinomadura macrotermitis TaxID=2585200 RepID=A0A7K0C725_9ACTN|nr:hypothetical protein [Actinomadura macrotermitis]MQY09235.1 hypothetical protein [Actinomadura macrotermitis]